MLGFIFVIGLIGLVLYLGSYALNFIEAPANEKETYKAIPKIFGKPMYAWGLFGPGQLWAPLAPFVVDYILVPQHDINFNIVLDDVYLPRGERVKVPVSGSFSIDASTPELRRRFVQNGGADGTKIQFVEKITERARALLTSLHEGPKTWEEVQGDDETLIAVLFRKIVDDVARLPGNLPTHVLLKYWHIPQKKPTLIEAETWGKKWENLRAELAKLADDERERLRVLVEERRDEIRKVRDGAGTHTSSALALVLQRLNIGEIKPLGEVAKEAEQKVAEEVQQRHFINLTKETARELHLDEDVAADRVEIQQGKVKKTKTDARYGISSDLLKAAPKLISDIVQATKDLREDKKDLREDKKEGV